MKKILCVLMIVAMVFTAECLGQMEIIFPEIAALVIGAWAAPKSPWVVDRVRLVLLMSLSSIIGVAIVRYISIGLFGQIILGFCFAAVSLLISRTTMVPMISACILPIILKTDSMVYPAAVCIMSIIIVVVQWGLEKASQKEELCYVPTKVDINRDGLFWIYRGIGLAVCILIPVWTKQCYFIAPPLIVTFVELTNLNSKARKRPVTVWCLVAGASIIGYGGRMLVERWNLSLTVGALFSMCLMFALFQVFHMMFPPAGAISLLPLILGLDQLWRYPIEVSIGCGVLIGCAWIVSQTENRFIQSKETEIVNNVNNF